MRNDTLADALSKIKNAQMAGKASCEICPASKLIGRVLKVMQTSGYVRQFEFEDDGKSGVFRVSLNGTINNCGVIKPRFAVKLMDLEKYESRYLPGQDFGILIMTTPKGVISHQSARDIHVGGKLLAFVY